jgi:outer membrane lipoprotein-sorting protein
MKAHNPAWSRVDARREFVNFSRLFSTGIAVAASAALALVAGASVRAANTAPAITAFESAFAATNDYTAVLHVHEAKGTQTQDRVYQYDFMKPHYAKTLILEGDGKGSGGVWVGTDQVSGHQGGLFSGIHLKVDIHDHRAVSLRGATIPDGLLQRIVEDYATIGGKLTQVDGGKIGGVSTDRLELKVADPSANNGISDMILYLSKDTHWPVRQIMYDGTQVVLDENVTDLKTNVGLKQSDFPF